MVSSPVTVDSNTCFWLPRQSSKIFWQYVERCSFWIEERSLVTHLALTFFVWRSSWMIRMTVVLGISILTEISLSVSRLSLSSSSSILFSSVTTSTGRPSSGSSLTLSLLRQNCLAHSCTMEYEGEASPKAPSKRCLIADETPLYWGIWLLCATRLSTLLTWTACHTWCHFFLLSYFVHSIQLHEAIAHRI